MVVLHTCKNEEDPIKNEDARVLTRLYVVFSDAQGQLTPKSAVEFGGTHLSFNSCPRNLQDPIKNKIFPIIRLWEFFKCSRAANSAVLGRIWLNFELVRDIINFLVTCKYVEDPIKNEGARVLTRLYDIFSDFKGQLTPKSAAEFCPNSNSSKLL